MPNPPTQVSAATMAALLALSFSAAAAQNPAGSTGVAVAANDKVHCYGVNSCKGQADCKTTANACKGQASCKGQGFKGTTAKDCLAQGGVIADLAAKK
ncbi:MAG: hypothetical protein KJ018_13980 [Burkholderiales bacterium]|nr:hypothetical protein [Burkholderiales bacterium]